MVYAEKFGCQPHEVSTAKLLWWRRWLLWEKARQAKAVTDRWLQSSSDSEEPLTGDDLDLFLWAQGKIE